MEKSLSSFIEEKNVTPRILALLQRGLLDKLADLEQPITVTADKIMISEDMRSVRLEISGEDETVTLLEMISSYGELLKEAHEACSAPSSKLERIAQRCIDGHYNLIEKIQLDVEKRISNTIYIPIIILIIGLIALLAWLNSYFAG